MMYVGMPSHTPIPSLWTHMCEQPENRHTSCEQTVYGFMPARMQVLNLFQRTWAPGIAALPPRPTHSPRVTAPGCSTARKGRPLAPPGTRRGRPESERMRERRQARWTRGSKRQSRRSGQARLRRAPSHPRAQELPRKLPGSHPVAAHPPTSGLLNAIMYASSPP